METLIWLIAVFILAFLFYSLYFKLNKKGKRVEIDYLIKKGGLDLKKVNKKRLYLEIKIINAFIITLVFALVLVIESIILKLFLALFLFISLIIVFYDILGAIYKKRGWTKDV